MVCVLTGLCLGADMALPPAIQADVADWDRLRYRRNRTAGLFSLWNMATKLALALAAGLLLPTLAALGIEEATPAASAVAGNPRVKKSNTAVESCFSLTRFFI